MMYSRYGRVYKPSGIIAKAAKFLAVTALVLITLFFYFYFSWQKYIVYTDDGLYLDLPFMKDSNKPSGGKPAAPVADSLSGDDAADNGTEDGTGDEANPDEGSNGATLTGESGDTAGEGAAQDGASGAGAQDDTAVPDDVSAPDDATGDDSGSSDDTGDDAADTTQPAVPAPGDTAEDEDKPKDNGVKDSFI